MTEASLQVLRSPENLQWHVVPLIALVMYIYNGELEKKRHGEVYLGIYFRWPNLYFMVIWWAVPYYVLLWLHDNLSLEAKGRLAAVSVVFAVGCHVLFAVLLGWV